VIWLAETFWSDIIVYVKSLISVWRRKWTTRVFIKELSRYSCMRKKFPNF